MTTRRSLLTNLGVLALLGGGVWLAREKLIWPAPRPQFSRPQGPWLPFSTPDQPLVTVLASIGGTIVHALIDSGAQYTSVDRAFVERLGLGQGPAAPMVAFGVGGGAQVARGVSLDLDLGGMHIPRLRCASLDLGVIASALGQSVPLIIGFDVLSAVAAEFDFPRRRMRVSEPATFQVGGGGLAAPVRRSGRALVADVTIEGSPLEVLVDTGATGLIGLSAEAAKAIGVDDEAGRQGQSVVLGGMAASRVVTVRRFDFAGIEFRDVEAHIIQLPRAPGFPKGLMGVEALREFRVLMDAGGGRMQLFRS